MVQLALRAEKLANERVAKGKYQKRKSFEFMSRQSSKKSRSSESLSNSSRSGANLLAHSRHFDLHSRLDLVHPRQVLLPKVKLHQKDTLVVINFILGLEMPLKCVFSVDKRAMLGDFVQCLILLHLWDKLWGSQEL